MVELCDTKLPQIIPILNESTCPMDVALKMTMLPSSSSFAPCGEVATASFGLLVQKIVQSNSGRHTALRRSSEVEMDDSWADFRTRAEQSESAGNFAHAEGMWLKAIFETHAFDDRDWRKAYSLDKLAGLYYSLDRFDEAEVFAERALTATRLAYGSDHLKTAESEALAGAVAYCLGKLEEACSHVHKSLTINEHILDPIHKKTAANCLNLAYIYHAKGDFDLSEPFYQRAFKIRAQIFGWDHEMTSKVSKAYAEMAIDRKCHLEAKQMVDLLMEAV